MLGLKTVIYTGVALGVMGATIDFYSGYSYLQGSGMSMAVGSLALGAALVALGVFVLLAGLLGLFGSMGNRMRAIGLVMEVAGVAMAVTSAWAPSMEEFNADAMLVVGALMFVNGLLMQRKPLSTANRPAD